MTIPPGNGGSGNGTTGSGGGSSVVCNYFIVTVNYYRTVCAGGECETFFDGSEQELVVECSVVHANTANTNETDCDPEDDIIPILDPEFQTEKPCNGNPVKNPKIAPQTWSKVKGARYGLDARKEYITDAQGNKILVDRPHYGLDIQNEFGDPIYSMYGGEVVDTGNNPGGWGNWMRVKSTVNGKTIVVQYAHMDSYSKSKGDTITAGDIIGKAGNSGNLKTAIKKGTAIQHLHIEVREGSNWASGTKKNPENYITTKFDSAGKTIENTKC